MADGITIPFSSSAVKRLAENVLDLIVVAGVVLLLDQFFDFNVVPQFIKTLIAWPVLIGAGWLTLKYVGSKKFFR